MACSLGGVKFPSTVVIELTLELKPKWLLLKTRVSLILCIVIDLEALVKALVSFIMQGLFLSLSISCFKKNRNWSFTITYIHGLIAEFKGASTNTSTK